MESIGLEGVFKYSTINERMLYIKLFGCIPTVYTYEPSEKKIVDFSKMNDDVVKAIGVLFFPGGYTSTMQRTKRENESTSCVDDTKKYNYDHAYFLGSHIESFMMLTGDADRNILIISPYGIEYLYDGNSCEFSIEDIEPRIDSVWKTILPLKNFEDNNDGTIKVVIFENGAFDTVEAKINSTMLNIDENYNDTVSNRYKDIEKFLDKNNRKSGAIFFRGEPGTGKTMLIRHIITNISNEYILMTASVASHIGSPDFISFLQQHKSSVFILEDCEQVVMDKSRSSFTGALSSILNMSDGLLSDIFNFKFICTYNGEQCMVDDALLRKGRCYGDYEFKKLSEKKTKVLCEKLGIKMDKYEEMSLADIYNYEDGADKKTSGPKKIGF